jgi:zinc protease
MRTIVQRTIVAVLLFFVCCTVWPDDAAALPPVRRTVLQNGIILLVSEEHSLPFVTVHLLVGSGSKDDPQGQEGLAELTSASLILGAGARTYRQIAEEMDFLGAHAGSGATKDYTTVSLRVLKKDIKTAFPIFFDIVTKPTFPEDLVRNEAQRILGAIRAAEDQPGTVAEKAFVKTLFGGGAYGHPTEGTKESVVRLNREAVERFHASNYRPGNAIVTIVGDADDEMIKGYLVPMLEKWAGKGVSPEKPHIRVAGKRETVKLAQPVPQSNIIIGNKGMSRDNPDYYAAIVMNHILGGSSLRSRLMVDIRGKRGLAYSAGSVFEARKYGGSFQVFMQTKNASAQEAIKVACADMEQMRTERVSEQELEDAKKYLVGSFPQRFGTQSRIASFLTLMEYFALGLDYPEKYPALINAVTRDDVLRVARRYLLPEEHITVIVGNLKEASLR